MDYKHYQQVRNAAWKILLDLKIKTLPVNPAAILSKLGISVGSYIENQNLIKHYHLEQVVKNSSGLTLHTQEKLIVLFNSTESKERIRFTLAHELGHIVCGHVSKGSVTLRNKEPGNNDNKIEREANMFAARLLAPACVLYECGLFDTDSISRVCGISLQSASFRLQRLRLLENRNQKFLETKGHGCFYQSSLEIKLREQFGEFISRLKNEDQRF